MIHNYFRVIYILIEKIVIGNTQERPGDVPWMFSKGPKIRDLQGTLRWLSGDQYKNW